MFRTNKDELSIDDIKDYVQRHRNGLERYKKLQDYYEGKHKILSVVKDSNYPNNKIINPYPKYITDTLTGYFIGQPVLYSANDKDDTKDDVLLEKLLEIFKYNDEQEENLELAKTASIKGVSYEILWTDNKANVRFKNVQPDEIFLIYDNTLEENIKFAIRYYSKVVDQKEVNQVYVYDKDKISYFDDVSGNLELRDVKAHRFRDVPVVMFENNKERMGDFEHVLSLIDAYDLSQSNTLNDMVQFTDSYLVLVNMGGTGDEDIDVMREKRTLLIDADGDAKWLIKDVNDSWVENYKNRIKCDIHKFSNTPDMSDESFGNNLSGVSLRYKLLGMEQLRSNKERKFKKGLQRRIELICNFLAITNKELIYTGIDMQFNNTLPQNILETSQIIQNLSNYLSTETLIEQLPFVENAKEEIEKKNFEEESAEVDYDKLRNLLSGINTGEVDEK